MGVKNFKQYIKENWDEFYEFDEEDNSDKMFIVKWKSSAVTDEYFIVEKELEDKYKIFGYYDLYDKNKFFKLFHDELERHIYSNREKIWLNPALKLRWSEIRQEIKDKIK